MKLLLAMAFGLIAFSVNSNVNSKSAISVGTVSEAGPLSNRFCVYDPELLPRRRIICERYPFELP
ncbi:MAG: hypothetical protein KDD25_02645 [Bdellovibrionales bacterium]|nr:hypothetical protein [Bdellovibrionales bacterium]